MGFISAGYEDGKWVLALYYSSVQLLHMGRRSRCRWYKSDMQIVRKIYQHRYCYCLMLIGKKVMLFYSPVQNKKSPWVNGWVQKLTYIYRNDYVFECSCRCGWINRAIRNYTEIYSTIADVATWINQALLRLCLHWQIDLFSSIEQQWRSAQSTWKSIE